MDREGPLPKNAGCEKGLGLGLGALCWKSTLIAEGAPFENARSASLKS